MISAQARKSFFSLFSTKSASYLRESHVSLTPQLHLLSTVAAQVSCKAPPTENFNQIALFLMKNGFSDSQLKRMLEKRQQLRLANLEKSIKPKIKVFKEFGFSCSEIVEIISKDPTVLCSSITNKIHPSLSLLRDFFGSSSKVFEVLRRSRRFLSTNLNRNVLPNIEFLKSRDVPIQRIKCLLRSFPCSLFNNHENFMKNIEKLDKLGVDSNSNVYIYALWAVASMTNEVWELKLQTFRDLGFLESECLDAFRKSPQMFITSPEKIKEVVEVVLATERYTRASILSFPDCFCYSIEKRLKPRLKVLKTVEENNLIENWPSLTCVASYTDDKFHRICVAPYE